MRQSLTSSFALHLVSLAYMVSRAEALLLVFQTRVCPQFQVLRKCHADPSPPQAGAWRRAAMPGTQFKVAAAVGCAQTHCAPRLVCSAVGSACVPSLLRRSLESSSAPGLWGGCGF